MISDEELARQAKIPVIVLRAIRQNESGDNPAVVRFEPHVFLRETGKGKRENSPFLKDIPFTRDPVRKISLVKSETDRAAFEKAALLDRDIAIKSTSWGLYQVLGAHLLKIDPVNPVKTFDANPREISDRLLVSWFKSNPKAAKAAREFDIMELARRYNGSERWGIRVQEIINKLKG